MEVEGARRKRTPLIDDYHLLTYQLLDSTNEEARRLAEGGGAHGAFIWAHNQTNGRGRKSREWVSQSGNLFVSALLSPECELAEFPQLSFVAAAAAYASIAPLLPEDELTFKWPNDLMLNSKKLAGLLLESFETENEVTQERKRWIVVGLGMNIEEAPEDDEVKIPATSLREAGVELVSAKIVLSRFIHHFVEWYELWQEDGFAPVQKYWMARCMHKGSQLEVQSGDQLITGEFEELDESGNLLLKDGSGKRIEIAAGEVLV